MDTERWQQIEEIYYAILEARLEDRAALLDRACGNDAELRRELESLLGAEHHAGKFLSREDLRNCLSQVARDSPFPVAGRTIGHYEIVSTLGSGGMGEVYLARDPHLDRNVALKLLPPAFAAHPERVARFTREAKAASALNHPNIITIYDTGPTGDTWFIAAEFIEGCTLRQKLNAGPVPLQEALEIAKQCAAALKEAHRAGIVHRDIKPENIMVRPDGLVKIVDFGLARTMEPELEGVQQATVSGSIFGTPRYMSPEQAHGHKVDARTDIFSLGAVLYEMVVRHPAFPGATTAEVFAALLGLEPDITGAGPLGPVISRALQKDRAIRYQTMDELADDLRRLEPEVRSRPVVRRIGTARLLQTRMRKVAVAASLLIVTGLATYAWISRRDIPADVNLKFTPITSLGGLKLFSAFSPDGSRIAFSWRPDGQDKERIYVKPLGQGDPAQLTSAGYDDQWPAWSPDGRWIAFCRSLPPQTNYGIYIISANGGAERKVADGGPGVFWSPDGKTLALARAPNIANMAASASGGISLLGLELGDRRDLTFSHPDILPVFSPDGKWIAFLRRFSGVRAEIFVIRTDGGPERQLTSARYAFRTFTWTADSREIIFSDEASLWRIPVTGGEPRLISATFRKGAKHPSMDRSGRRLAFVQDLTKINLYLLAGPGFQGGAPGPFAQPSAIAVSGSMEHSASLSPDGERITFVSNRSGIQVIWTSRRDGSQAAPLTSEGAAFTGSPRWSPDGRRIAYDSWGSGQSVVYVAEPGGAGPRLLSAEPEGSFMPSWSPDGEWIYFICGRSGVQQICKIPAEGGATIQLTHGGANGVIPSPDGRLVYFTRNAPNAAKTIWSIPSHGGPERPVPELQKFNRIRRSWGVLKEGIYFMMQEKTPPLTVQFLSFETGKVVPLFRLPKDSPWDFPTLTLSSDARYAVVSQVEESVNDVMMIENFR
jgi:serine/threonine protein kinase/Tol biopolymer transport system component